MTTENRSVRCWPALRSVQHLTPVFAISGSIKVMALRARLRRTLTLPDIISRDIFPARKRVFPYPGYLNFAHSELIFPARP